MKAFAVLLIVFSIGALFTAQPSFVLSQQPSTTTATTTTTNKGLGWLPEPVTTTRTTVTTTRTYPPLPERLDWTDYQGHNWVTPVRDQGWCGSCVAFATVGAVEAQYRIYYNSSDWNIDLSEQHLFSCGGGQCSFGWYLSSAMDYMRDYGTPDEPCYPYGSGDGNDRPCSGSCPDWSSKAYKISSWNWVNPTVPDIEVALMTGPVLAAFSVYYDFYYGYHGGVYHWDHASIRLGGHAVVIVGYDNVYQYWKVKNSWGPDWGENGFFRIGFGEAGIEDNVITISLAPTVTFNTNPSIYPGMSPSTVTACGGTFTDGQSTTSCGRVFSASGNPPSATGDWTFHHWEWNGGVNCTSETENPANCTVTGDGTLRAAYAAKVTFYTKLPVGSISWGSCSGPGITNGQSLYDQNLQPEYNNQVTACANIPQGYTFSGWSCDGGLSCSGTGNPTAAVFTGPGSITALFSPPPAPTCAIATAAYGSSMMLEVVYMRYVRDQMIGSTSSGRVLVDSWNRFYYSWSPPVASAIAGNEWTQRAFRVLFTPLVGIIHATAGVYGALASAGDTASILAFATAAILSTTAYIIIPALVIKAALKHRRGSRG